MAHLKWCKACKGQHRKRSAWKRCVALRGAKVFWT